MFLKKINLYMLLLSRLSKQWSSNVWSGRIEDCHLDVKWSRVCNETKYFTCIYNIFLFYEIDATHQHNVLNGINEEARELYDTFEDEFDCLEQHCPWTPRWNIFCCLTDSYIIFLSINNSQLCRYLQAWILVLRKFI